LAAFELHGPQPARQTQTGPLEAVRRLVAALVFDTRQQSALAAGRDASPNSFQQLFQADGVEIDLLYEHAAGGWQITGQALWEETKRFHTNVRIHSGAGETEVELDSHGEFRVSGLAPGECRISLRTPEAEIVLPPVQLEEAGH
jgi:hypothetical protein